MTTRIIKNQIPHQFDSQSSDFAELETPDLVFPEDNPSESLEEDNPLNEHNGEKIGIEEVFGAPISIAISDEISSSEYERLLDLISSDEPSPKFEGIKVDEIIYEELGRFALLTRQEEEARIKEFSKLGIEYTAAIFSSRMILEYTIPYLLSGIKDKSTAQTIFDYEMTGVDGFGRSASERLQLKIEANVGTLRELLTELSTKTLPFPNLAILPTQELLRNDEEIQAINKKVLNVILDCSLRPSALRFLERVVLQDSSGETTSAQQHAVREASRKFHEARNELITANLRLAAYFAGKKRSIFGIHTSDLLSPAFEGLIIGIEKFSPQHGNKISTYVSNWIRQKISRFLFEDTRDVSVPIAVRQKLMKISRISESIFAATGREPEFEEVAKQIGVITPKEMASLKNARKGIYSGSHPFKNDASESESQIFDLLASTIRAPDERVINSELIDKAITSFKKLEERERLVLSLRLGLIDLIPPKHYASLAEQIKQPERKNFTLDEIGNYLEITKEWVRKIEAKAINKIQKDLSADGKELFN